jgi:hypothetical protein
MIIHRGLLNPFSQPRRVVHLDQCVAEPFCRHSRQQFVLVDLHEGGGRCSISFRDTDPRRQGAGIHGRGFDWSAKYPVIVKAAAELRVKSAIVDGDVVVLDERA